MINSARAYIWFSVGSVAAWGFPFWRGTGSASYWLVGVLSPQYWSGFSDSARSAMFSFRVPVIGC